MAGQGGRAGAEHETGTSHLVAITSGGASVASSLVSYFRHRRQQGLHGRLSARSHTSAHKNSLLGAEEVASAGAEQHVEQVDRDRLVERVVLVAALG